MHSQAQALWFENCLLFWTQDTANSPLLLEIIVSMSLCTNVQSTSHFFWELLVSMLACYLENSICGCAWTNNTARHEGYQAFDGVWVICVPSWFLKVHILYPQNVSSNTSYWNLLSYLLGAQIVEGDSWHFFNFFFLHRKILNDCTEKDLLTTLFIILISF